MRFNDENTSTAAPLRSSMTETVWRPRYSFHPR